MYATQFPATVGVTNNQSRELMTLSIFPDRFLSRAIVGAVCMALGFWGARSFEGLTAGIFIVILTGGFIAFFSGLVWIGADAENSKQDGSVISSYPVGHVFAAVGLVGVGVYIASLTIQAGPSDPVWAILGNAAFAIGSVVIGLVSAFHCATYRIQLQQGALSVKGGIFPKRRTLPIPLSEISMRKGVGILTGISPTTYRLTFVRKRHIDLPAAMTGTKKILKAANAYYEHDFMWDTHPKEN
ncbi:hypothetical protein [Shimia sp. SK013]|uniref:hypothetical protein n=1 Tax=Shimia sp. SK013 TaxID=1389006 RepID=UPI00128F1BF4|nr:hypothetical protein [Shimia sp. SK013]